VVGRIFGKHDTVSAFLYKAYEGVQNESYVFDKIDVNIAAIRYAYTSRVFWPAFAIRPTRTYQ